MYKCTTVKEPVPTVNILGVNIAAIDMRWLMEYTKKHVNELSGEYICVSNVHTAVMSYEDEEFRRIQNDAIIAIPDGAPLSVVGRRRGGCSMRRTTGPDYLKEILRLSSKTGWTHFFYGSTKDTLDKISERLKVLLPETQIAGLYSPPYRDISTEEDEKIVDMINNASPDFVWVGLGAPKQEIWMAAHRGRIKGLMVGVGAAFDYYADNLKRAPIWMQRANLEWLYRLAQEPKRLLRRYAVTNCKFIWNVVIRGK